MTEHRRHPAPGGSAWWNAPIVLAPCAAAVFGASVWWAAGTTPTTGTVTTAITSPSVGGRTTTPGAPGDSRRGENPVRDRAPDFRRSLARQRHDSAVLEHRLARLTETLNGLRAASRSASAVAPAPPAPAPVRLAPAAAAPPVHSVTGASGSGA